MSIPIARLIAAAAGASALVVATAATGQQARKSSARSRAEEAKAKAKTAEADARARAAEAESKARTAEAQAKAEAAKAEAEAKRESARLQAEADKRESDARAEAARVASEKEKREFEAKEGSTEKTLFTLGLTAAAAVVGILIGKRMGGAAAAKIAASAAETVKSISLLGRDAAALTKTAGRLAGTPKGDQLRGIVNEAYALGGVKTAFASPGYQAAPKAKELFGKLGKPDAGAFALPALNVAQGGGALIASTQVEDKSIQTALRIEGTAAIAAGVFGSKALLAARAASPRPSSRAIASIEAGRNRLIREGATPAARSPLAKASAPASQAAAPARRPRVAANDQAPVKSFQRTYKSGPKAGMTEVVQRR